MQIKLEEVDHVSMKQSVSQVSQDSRDEKRDG
jgi:hypothetical protein